jgi:hypothetical protein
MSSAGTFASGYYAVGLFLIAWKKKRVKIALNEEKECVAKV